MNRSPTIEITEQELRGGEKLTYVSTLFKGTLQQWPAACIVITGSSAAGSGAADYLRNVYGIPAGRIKLEPSYDAKKPGVAYLAIAYFPAAPGTTSTFKLRCTFDLGDVVEIEFEVSPDGAFVKEVSATIDLLKKKIKEKAFGGRVKDIKIAVQAVGEVEWDREVSTKVETEITGKLRAALEGDVKLPGNVTVNVQLYGEYFKQSPGKDIPTGGPIPFRGGIEGGIILKFPF